MNNHCILIVDDNETTLKLLHKVTRTHCTTATIYTTLHSHKALDYATSLVPDLLIVDLDMPALNGIDLIKILKRNLRTQSIAVLMVTAHADRINAPRILDHFREYDLDSIMILPKPIDIVVFRSVIDSLSNRTSGTQQLDKQNQSPQPVVKRPRF